MFDYYFLFTDFFSLVGLTPFIYHSCKAPTDELDALLSDLKVDETNDVSTKRKKKGELPILYSKEQFQKKIDQVGYTHLQTFILSHHHISSLLRMITLPFLHC